MSCYHCGQPLPDSPYCAEIKGEEKQFCCFACQSVCQAIYEAGMEGFYQRTPEGQLLAPPPEPPKDIELYDIKEIQAEFVQDRGDTQRIQLMVEGIHCAACVWLIEHRLHQLDGVRSARVNLSAKRLLLDWHQQQMPLSKILAELSRIGYAAVPFDPEAAEGALKKQTRDLLFRITFAGFAMMNLLWISIALYAGADEGEFRQLFHWVGFALATPTLFYSGWPFLKGAWISLKTRHLGMDLPIAIGATITWAYSTWVTFNPDPDHHVYFDTVVNFIFVILVGRHLEGVSKRHAVAATQRLLDLQPRVATVLIEGQEKKLPIRQVRVGDRVLIKPGGQVPVDGVIVSGQAHIDESMLSGESKPVLKTVGDKVSAGTLNIDGSIQVEVTATLGQTTLGRIIQLVEEAQASKAPIQCTADRIVPWFVAATLSLATLTFLIWWSTDFELALMAATSVLIITCPCAFGLATPMAIAVASGQGARHGILVKNGAVLELLSKVDHFIFDKTGTLTRGQMEIAQIITAPLIKQQELLRLTAAVESLSEHRLAQAIVRAAQEQDIDWSALEPQQFQAVAGRGVFAVLNQQRVSIGHAAWLQSNGIKLNAELMRQAKNLEKKAMTVIHIALNQHHAGLIALADQLRPDARELIEFLRQKGMGITLLSGDRQAVVQAIADQLGGNIEVIAEVLPEDKYQVVAAKQKQGHLVAMVGDGINDAPALIQADIGIAIGSGTDVSVESADLVLMGDELSKIQLALQLSQRTLKTIRQNIGISFIYNLIMVPLAMAAKITPLIAAISMPISSLLVIGNAARIRSLFKHESTDQTSK